MSWKKRPSRRLVGVVLNLALLIVSAYILLFSRPLNPVAVVSAVMCPVAMALRYRGLVLGKWLSMLNGAYLLAFFLGPLAASVLTDLPLSGSVELFLVALGAVLSALLLLDSVFFAEELGSR